MVKRLSCCSDQMLEWGRNVIQVTLTVELLLVPDRGI